VAPDLSWNGWQIATAHLGWRSSKSSSRGRKKKTTPRKEQDGFKIHNSLFLFSFFLLFYARDKINFSSSAFDAFPTFSFTRSLSTPLGVRLSHYKRISRNDHTQEGHIMLHVWRCSVAASWYSEKWINDLTSSMYYDMLHFFNRTEIVSTFSIPHAQTRHRRRRAFRVFVLVVYTWVVQNIG